MASLLSRTPTAKANRTRALRPAVENLEGRLLLYAVTGDHFAFGSRITWSIMPDGTNLGGFGSNLNSTLNSEIGAPSSWLPVLQDAFAEWEAVANVNFAQVSDDGSPFGSGAYQQGSPTVGDIRIGGFAQGSGTLAFTMLPPGANGGSAAGDIFINTSLPWNVGKNYDLETVFVHEIGHALGMGHSASTSAVMYPYYQGIQDFPNTDDIAGVQSIWGPRAEDPFEQATNNLTFANAANVNAWLNPSNGQVYLPGLDVASTAESYWFKVTTPANTSAVFTAQVQSSALSELSPRVQIFNASGVGLAQTSAAPWSYGATINATITNATPNTTYYVRVLGSNSGDSGTGGYTMTLNMGFGYIATAPPPNTTVYAQPDQGGGATQQRIGGANTTANTEVNVPDTIMIGSLTVQGDALTALPTATPPIRLNIPHPVARISTKISLVRDKTTDHVGR